MTTREDAIAACMLDDAYEDYPFDDANWTVMRHRLGDRCFAMIFEREGHVWMNLNQTPEDCFILRELYTAVLPAYHMNKRHWVSLVLDGSMTDDAILPLIRKSYDLTAKKLRRAKNA